MPKISNQTVPPDLFSFEEQYHTFNAYGFAADPSAGGGQQQMPGGAGPSGAVTGEAAVGGDAAVVAASEVVLLQVTEILLRFYSLHRRF